METQRLLTLFSATLLKILCKDRNIRTNGATKRELIHRLQKYATQAVVYDGRPKKDLLKEAKARNLDCSQTKTSPALIALLESADRSRTFHHFLELPAELRNMIYRFAAVVDDPMKLPGSPGRVPAICRASTQLRDESAVMLDQVKVDGRVRARKARCTGVPTMSSSICMRCLKRAVVPSETSWPLNTAQRAAFSISPSHSANPPKKTTKKTTQAKSSKTLRLPKNMRAQTARPPAPGERKAMRKKIVLSNANALEVAGLENLTTEGVRDMDKLRELEGQVLGFDGDTVDALRALEAFKPGQGWGLFKRPAALVRRDLVHLGAAMQSARESKSISRRIFFGERGSGKSVLLLQGMATAYLQGFVVLYFPDARPITDAQTAYQPIQTAEGETIYIQPRYIAHVLGNIAAANRGLLDGLRLSKQHQLPIPLQSNLSLARLLELGANDPQLAYPIWQAFLSEITAPSQPEKTGQRRPPIFVGMDGVDHIMRMSAYLDTESKPIHAHDLAIARDFLSLLSCQTHLPNGGVVMAATSTSTRPLVPTFDHYLARKHADTYAHKVTTIVDDLLQQVKIERSIRDIGLTDLEQLPAASYPQPLAKQVQDLQYRVRCYQDQNASLSSLQRYLRTFAAKLPEWDPYEVKDERVAKVMESGMAVTKVEGLSKDEARSVMEYYARSGMMRGAVTEGLVSERWTLAGCGIVGELEKGLVRARF
ncbi:hypothetical protein LTR54_004813 [Friedmanniomyces endolithicus]|nr:hypothetical protein LTR54_004813 [Friedmanniomyces endolithicus]